MKKERHFFEDCVKVGDELWFSALKENALCRKNLTTGKLEIVDQFAASPCTIRLHSRVFYEQGLLYFVPANADALAVYRIADRKCKYFDSPKLRVHGIKPGAPYYHFDFAVQSDRRIYMVSLLSPEITVFDMDTEIMETVYIKELDCRNGAYHHTFGGDAAVWDGKLYMTVYGTAKLLELQMQSFSYRILECPENTASFCCMAQDKGILYIIDNTNAGIYSYQTGTGRFGLLCRGFAKPNTELVFVKSIFREQKLYLFRNYADYFYIYDILRGCCQTVKAGECPPEEAYLFCEEHMERKYYGFWQSEEGICFYYAPSDTMCLLNAQGGLSDIPFFDSQAKRILTMQRLQKVRGTGVYRESQPGDLELFINNISPKHKSLGFEHEMTTGEQIYKTN